MADRERAARDAGPGRATLRQRAVAWAFILSSGLAARLPVPFLHHVARLVGAIWYLAAPRRRAIGRANLQRVCAYLVERGMATPSVAAAARDPRALERLLRDAFRHYASYYLEVLALPRFTAAYLVEHLAIDDPALVEKLLAADGPLRHGTIVGLHFGALELPALYLTEVLGIPVVAPMETIGNAPLQAALIRVRARSGVRIVPLGRSGPTLAAAFEDGASVGLVADRDIGRSGARVQLFGHPAPLPTGPAFFAVEAGAPLIAAAVRRTGPGEYAAAVIPIESPGEGSRTARARAATQAMAGAMERLVALAPEQWWTLFFPIWPDLDGARPHDGSAAPEGDGDGS